MSTCSRRNFLKLSGMALAGSVVPLGFGSKLFASPTGVDFGSVRFAVIADMHVDIKGKNGMKMSAISTQCLEKTVTELNQEKDLAFVLVAGDLLLDGELENARVVKKSLDRLKMPYNVISGNHDYIPANPKKHRKDFNYLTSEQFIDFFEGNGYDGSGKGYYALQIKPGLRLIGLDACLPLEPKKWGGVLPQEQMTWLDKQLSDHSDQLNLIFMHHNFIPWSADELPGGPKQWFTIDNDAEARALLSKHSAAAPVVITGHRHIGLNYKELNGVNYFAVPSLNSYPMRYSVFNLSNRSLAWKTQMVSVPESAHLEAKNNLLSATWWREAQFADRTPGSDTSVLDFYENNRMITGSIDI